MFENIRTNTQAISNSHVETEQALKKTVAPILGRLHQEIKDRVKVVRTAVEKGSKAVLKAQNHTQNHIELLGQHASSFDSVGSPSQATNGGGHGGMHIHIPGTHNHTTTGKPKPDMDPYVLRRGVLHRLHKQVIEENNSRQELLSVQNQMQQFEAHVIQTIQQAMNLFYQHVSAQADRQKALYGDIVGMLPSIFQPPLQC